MSTPSNSYSEKIYAQHPLAMWSLDDESYYLTKISESDRDISQWAAPIGGTATAVSDSSAPFPSSYVTRIDGTATPSYAADARVYASSTSIFSSNGFTISFYLKTQYICTVYAGYGSGNVVNISSVAWDASYLEFTTSSNHGFSAGEYVQVSGVSPELYDGAGTVSATGLTADKFRIYKSVTNQNAGSGGQVSGGKTDSTFINPADYPTNSWIPVSFTFDDNVTDQKMLLSFSYSQTSPQFFVSGITIGKDSQPFNGESLGQTTITIPTDIATTQTKAIEAKSYGVQDYIGYYICDSTNTDIYAKNSGISMAYGSESSMRVYPNATANQPSFIFPGFGMLNDVGRYKTLTLQTLIRIAANNSVPKRIIGPLASTDGIYVTKDFISLKIGNNIESFSLPEMYRPMVMQLKVGINFAKLSIDGEEIISLQTDSSTLSLPAKLNNSDKNQDWLGIYAYTDVPLIEVGSIAIYPYQSSDVMCKLNFVNAQAVDIPTVSNSSLGQTISPDFTFANYINNYNYPSFQAKWQQATVSENLDVLENDSLSVKQFTKPDVNTTLYDSDKMFLDIYETFVASGESNTFINLKPSTVVAGSSRSWSSNQGYFSLNVPNKSDYLSNCVYGVFKSLETSGTKQILLKISSATDSSYFQVSLTNTTVSYDYKYGSGSETNITTKSITQGTPFAIGFDISKLINLNPELSGIFANKTNLQIFVGGKPELTNTFSGNIYKIGLCTTRNSIDISGLFSSNGILTSSSSYSSLLSKIASYTVYGLNAFGKINLDIGTVGYWQDYVPLSKLAKTVINKSGNEEVLLDFVQLNLDYEEPRTYSSGNFVTSGLPIRGYVTFQTLASGANKDLLDFVTTQSASSTRVIDASTFSASTKYEFVNGMIVYPPTDVDISTLAMVVHLDMSTDACILKPIRTRFVQLAAQSFNKNLATKIGTKYDVSLYPYIYDGANSNTAPTYPYDYNSKNPYLMYKQSTPHLYLSRHSGVRPVGTFSSNYHRGLYARLSDFSPDKKITSIQMSVLPDFESLSGSQRRLFSIKTNFGEIEFKAAIVPGTTNKAEIYTTSSTPIVYYLNGRKVGSPVITINEWNMLGIGFLEPLDVSNSQGTIFISSDILVNNISCHYANPTELDQKSSPILWSQVAQNNWRIPVPTQTPARVGNSITLTTTGDHNLVVGEKLTFYDIVPDSYGIGFGGSTLKISKKDSSTSFTYENSNAATSPITTAGSVVGTWQYATIPNYYSLYGNSLDNIYDQFTGRNRVIIDIQEDSPVMQLNGYKYTAYMDVQTTTSILDVK